MDNIIEKLLKVDAGKLELPSKNYEVKRLSKTFGFKFELELHAIPAERYMEIQKNSLSMKKGDVNEIDMYSMSVNTILAGTGDFFKNADLRKHFSATTPKELINKLFLAAEISDIAAEISKLCGYDSQEETDEKVKN